MLLSLSIRNVALVDQVITDFHPGMQVLTGETGAGKSIIVDAVNLLLGNRPDKSLIRSGETKACVEAQFDISGNPTARELLRKEQIAVDSDQVSLYREININDRNACRINGVPVTVALMKEASRLLINLHGQNDQVFLSDPGQHMKWVDSNGDEEHRRLLKNTKGAYHAFILKHKQLAAYRKKNENREDRIRQISSDLAKFSEVTLNPEEKEELRNRLHELKMDEKTLGALETARMFLEGDSEEDSVLQRLNKAASALKVLTGEQNASSDLHSKLESVCLEAEDILYELERQIREKDPDSGKIEQTEHQLEAYAYLNSRFGPGTEELVRARNQLEEELQELNELESIIRKETETYKTLLREYRDAAKALTGSRKEISLRLKDRIEAELHTLGIPDASFEVVFLLPDSSKPVMPSETGDDRLEFMFSANRGEPMKPLSSVASGGELSRIMLAIKTIEARHLTADTMVFDEIDTGISGRVAQAVAEKMMLISRHSQVICVTHLPQIAAAADYHYLVSKSFTENRTVTSVKELDNHGKTEEIARMICGAQTMDNASVQYAEQLLLSARKIREEKLFLSDSPV